MLTSINLKSGIKRKNDIGILENTMIFYPSLKFVTLSMWLRLKVK